MKAVALFCAFLLLTLILAIGAGYLFFDRFGSNGTPKAHASQSSPKPLPQGWNIVYQRTNNLIPESVMLISSNRIVYRFAIDYRTNLVSRTKATR